ncbi:MAG TPA: hypothetical protein VFN23_18515, partial [Ktedonobacteraceae bacterium]|nr:hypothetical protein [Ktedonobacteraceae bacterium]
QVVLKEKKIDTDQLLELVRKLEKKMAVLEEHAASSDEKMLTTLDTVGEHYQLLQNFQQQAQAMLPPARQIAAPKA